MDILRYITFRKILPDKWLYFAPIIICHRFYFTEIPASTNWNPGNSNNANLEYINFDPTFLNFLGEIEHLLSIRPDVFDKMTSNIAKAIYLYIPSRALKNTASNPFKITLTNLYRQINIKIPVHKSNRYQKLTQNNTPVLAQLDNAAISYSKKLRVRLEETRNHRDYNFCAWVKDICNKDFEVPGKDSLRT